MRTHRKSMSRRDFLRLSALGASGMALAACAPKVEPTTAGAEPTKALPPAEKVKIRYQSREPEMAGGIMQLWDEFYPAFREKNPTIEVEFLPDPGGADRTEKSLAAMVAGDSPDLEEQCCWESTYFMQKGQTLDLQPLIERDAAEVNMDDYLPNQFDPWKDDKGDIHLLPRFTGTMVVYFNKDWFDRAGVAYPSQEWGGWDFDDYVETCLKFVSREQPITWGTSNYGYGANWLCQYLIRGFGAHMVNPDDHDESGLCEPKAIDSLKWIHKGIWTDHTFSYGSEMGGLGLQQLFYGERIAMMEIGPWELGPVVENARFKWDVAPMPDGPAGPTTHQSVDGTFIWKGTAHKEESWTLLKALTSVEYGKLYIKYATKQPSRKSVLPDFAQILREQAEIYQDIKLEVFTDSIAKNIGAPEEMFNNDQVCKSQILQPAFDRVMLLNEAPVDLICRHAELCGKFNKGEIDVENLGAALEAIQ